MDPRKSIAATGPQRDLGEIPRTSGPDRGTVRRDAVADRIGCPNITFCPGCNRVVDVDAEDEDENCDCVDDDQTAAIERQLLRG